MNDRLEEARREAERRLEESRRQAELRLAEVRTAVKTEVGFVPRKKYLLMALAAGAAGFARRPEGWPAPQAEEAQEVRHRAASREAAWVVAARLRERLRLSRRRAA